MTNEEIQEIIKDISTSTGGQLSNDQLSSFIESGVEQNTVLQDEYQVVQVTASEMDIDVLEVDSRILRKSVEGSEFTTKTGVTIPRRKLKPTEVKLRWNVTDKFLRRNISRDQANAQIQKLMSARALNDLLDLSINGDDSLNANEEPFLSIMDGVLVKFDADDDAPNVVPFNAADNIMDVFDLLIEDMPADFSGDEDKLRFIMSPKTYRRYLKELKKRNTQLGDEVITGKVKLPYEGIKIITISRFPETKIIHTLTKNLTIGYGMDATLESQRNIFSSSTDYVLTMEADTNYAISKAMRMAKQN